MVEIGRAAEGGTENGHMAFQFGIATISTGNNYSMIELFIVMFRHSQDYS